jgi:hypothetical protein
MKPQNYKKCVDCLYYVANHVSEHSVCLKFGKKFFNEFETAEKARKDPQKCGPAGNNYISKYLK